MRFFSDTHAFYCGIDLHARSLYLCVLDAAGQTLLHRNVPASPEAFLGAIAPFREGIVVGAECTFTWYWLADLCAREEVPFVLGHALYMRAIHGAKAKNDRVDSDKIARLLRGGMFPMAYAYPEEWRSTRDLLRRRTSLVRHRAELLAHLRMTEQQYNVPSFPKDVSRASNRDGFVERFEDPQVQINMETDLTLIETLDQQVRELELHLTRSAKRHDAHTFHLLRSVPGIGKILALTILYEINDISRFPRRQEFLSYTRLVKCAHESAGKKLGSGGKKIGNAHLKWAFSEAAVLFLRGNERGQKLQAKLQKKHGKGKALSIIARKIGSAVYYMLKRKEPFDDERFYQVK